MAEVLRCERPQEKDIQISKKIWNVKMACVFSSSCPETHPKLETGIHSEFFPLRLMKWLGIDACADVNFLYTAAP